MIKRREYTDIPTDQNILLHVLMFWNHLLRPPNCVQNKIKRQIQKPKEMYICIFLCNHLPSTVARPPNFHFAPNHKFYWVFN